MLATSAKTEEEFAFLKRKSPSRQQLAVFYFCLTICTYILETENINDHTGGKDNEYEYE